jgi:RimJ/RimL family protein N-acetyltransferase
MIPDYHTTAITNGRILLRPIYPQDAGQLYDAVMASFRELHQWMPWCNEGYSLEDSTEWCGLQKDHWGDGTSYSFAIIDRDTGSYLGGCGLNRIDRVFKTASLGYWVRSDWNGKNIATEATELTAAWGLQLLQLNRIEIITAVGNTASIRVAEKAGATYEGRMRNRLEYNGVVHDAFMFSIIREGA